MPTGRPMNSAQARVIDPILSDHARGYSNASFVGQFLFPTVDMPTRAAKRIEFDRSSFRRRRTRRAPGTPINRLEFGYEGKPVALHQEALGAIIPIEYQQEAQEVPGIDLQQTAVDLVLASIAMEKEIQQAEVARNAASYANTNRSALAGADKWSADTSNPKVQIADAAEAIRARTGRRPNTLLLGPKPAKALSVHPKILDHFKYTTAEVATLKMLASYLDLDSVIRGDAIYDTDDVTTVDVWGNDSILAYVPPAGQRSMPLPSYGYTYQLSGHPLVEQVRWDPDFRSWKNDVIDEFSAELVGADAGFLFQNCN